MHAFKADELGRRVALAGLQEGGEGLLVDGVPGFDGGGARGSPSSSCVGVLAVRAQGLEQLVGFSLIQGVELVWTSLSQLKLRLRSDVGEHAELVKEPGVLGDLWDSGSRKVSVFVVHR